MLPPTIYSGGKCVSLALKCSRRGPCVCSLTSWTLLCLCVNSLTLTLTSCQEERKKTAFVHVPGPIVSAVRVRASCCSARASGPFCSPLLLLYACWGSWVRLGRVGPGWVRSALLCARKRHQYLCRWRDRRTWLTVDRLCLCCMATCASVVHVRQRYPAVWVAVQCQNLSLFIEETKQISSSVLLSYYSLLGFGSRTWVFSTG